MMGELGIDNVQNDVIINHGVFNETSILVTNDVVEQYIDKAVSKNIISLDDIINTALNLFNSHSYNSIRVDRIISESGVAKMTFYK